VAPAQLNDIVLDRVAVHNRDVSKVIIEDVIDPNMTDILPVVGRACPLFGPGW
jgi:hypothetical protein